MKFVCEQCGETTDAASIRLEKAAALLTCAHCGVETRLTAHDQRGDEADAQVPTPTADEPPADDTPEPDEPGEGEAEETDGEAEEIDEGAQATDATPSPDTAGAVRGLAPHKCPKCFHRQQHADFCERCGLDLSSSETSRGRWDVAHEGLEEEHRIAMELWAAVERSPAKDGAHEAFIEHCSESDLLELAVRRYRSRLADHPGENPTESFATVAIHRLEVLALAKISTDRWSDDLARRVRTARRVLFVVAVVLLVVGLILVVVMFRKQGSLLPGSM